MARRRSTRSRSVVRKNNYVWISTSFGPTSVVVGGFEVADAVVADDWQTLGTFEDGCVVQRCIVSLAAVPDTTASLFPVGDYNLHAGWSKHGANAPNLDLSGAAIYGLEDCWGIQQVCWMVGGVGLTAGFLGTNMVVPCTRMDQDLKVKRRITDADELRFTMLNDATSNSDIAVFGSTRVLLKLP